MVSRRYAGIDWASDRHAVCVVDERGGSSTASRSSTRPPGCGSWCRRLHRRRRRVAIERPDGPVIDALLEADIRVVVIASRHVKALRTRHGLAGNKDDRSDAYVLADALRTDGHRLRPLRPTARRRCPARPVRARKDLVQARVAARPAAAGAPRARLPRARSACSPTSRPIIARRFLLRFPSAERAAWLCRRRLGAWLRGPGLLRPAQRRASCTPALAGPGGSAGDAADAMAAVTSPTCGASPRSRPGRRARGPHRRAARAPSRRRNLHRACPARARSGRRPCWPRSATAGSASRRPSRSPASPGRRRRPASRASTARSPSASPATRSCATRSSTSPRTAGSPTPGRPTSTPGAGPRQDPSPRRAHPRPGLVRRDLALLAGPYALRPGAPPRPAAPRGGGGLT